MNRRLSACLLAMAAAVLSGHLFAEEMDDSGVDDPHLYHLTDTVDLTSTNRIDYFKPKIIANVVYPVLSDDVYPESVAPFNDAVNKLLKDEEDAFKQKVAEAQSYQANLPKKQIHNRLTIDFDSSFLDLTKQPIISIRFVVESDITGLAHPEHHHRVLNMLFDDEAPLELNELFKADADYLSWISQTVTDSLIKKLGSSQVFAEALSPTPDHFSLWNLEPSGLRFTFDPGMVAPAVYGTQTVVIPYEKLQPLLDPDSPLSDCFNNPKRCTRNRLMTGGFIDQAANTPKHIGVALSAVKRRV